MTYQLWLLFVVGSQLQFPSDFGHIWLCLIMESKNSYRAPIFFDIFPFFQRPMPTNFIKIVIYDFIRLIDFKLNIHENYVKISANFYRTSCCGTNIMTVFIGVLCFHLTGARWGNAALNWSFPNTDSF